VNLNALEEGFFTKSTMKTIKFLKKRALYKARSEKMKHVIISVPLMRLKEVRLINYPVDGNKAIEYGKDVRCPINGVLAKTMKKGEQVKVIYITTVRPGNPCEIIKKAFMEELEAINAGIGAILSYDTVEMEFLATRQVHNKLITDLSEKIPENAEIYADLTYGFKTETLAIVCAIRFVEEFRDADVKYLIYGKLEKNPVTRETEHCMLFDVTSLYYLFKMIGSIGNADAESASKLLKDVFAL
jgi:hypothetical protein